MGKCTYVVEHFSIGSGKVYCISVVNNLSHNSSHSVLNDF